MIRTLATSTTDPNKSGELMLEAAKTRVKMTKRVLAFNFVRGCRRRRVGTEVVEKMGKVLTEMEERDEGVVLKLMDIVVKSSEKKVQAARKAAFNSGRKAKDSLPPGWMRKRFRDILRQEVEPLWQKKKKTHAKRKDALEAKHKPRQEEDKIRGIPISDEKLGPDNEVVEVLAYGVEVSEEEKSFLRLPKSATDYAKIDAEKLKTSIQVTAAKLRMSLQEQEDGAAHRLDEQEEEALLASKRVYDPEEGKIDFKKKKVTDMTTCKRITVPSAAETSKEAKIQVLINNLEDVVKRNGTKEAAFLKAGGPDSLSTMSESARRGKQSILEREKAGELVLLASDKSGKLAVMSPTLYRECMQPHIEGDSEHTRDEVVEVERQFNGAATQILRAFKFGEDWSHQERFKSACAANNNEVPSLCQYVKDHKAELKTRPVCKAQVQQSPNGPLADLLCEVINPFVEEADKANRTEVRCTEELSSRLKRVNEKIKTGGLSQGPYQKDGKLIVGSKDVKSFYPEMDVEEAAKEVRLEIEESDLEIEVDTVGVALFLACSMSQKEVDDEGLKDVVHRRRFNAGARPGLTCKAITAGPAGRQADKSWLPPTRAPDRAEKMKMIGCLVQTACKLVMQNHFYTFDNKIRKQKKGGAIGNKLTERLGRILMKRHDRKYLEKLGALGLETEDFARYVDDETEVMASVEPGVRYDGEKLVRIEELVEEDEAIEEDLRTMNLLKTIANDITECVKFTVDCPSLNQDGRVPVLDLGVSVEDGQVVHDHYEKPCASKFVIPYKSAHSKKMKMAVLVEEGVRRLRNASRGLEWERSRVVMERWSRKLRRSGYPATVRHQVIKTALEKWDKMCEDEDAGVRPIHRPREWKEKERRQEKEKKRQNWHQSKEGQVSAPLIIDPTAGGLAEELKDVCRKFEEVTDMRVAVQERAGNALKHLAKSEPLKIGGCGRDDCFPCTTSGPGKCEKSSVGYRIRCEACFQAGKASWYDGETGCNCYTRGKQHAAALRLENEENALWKHCLVEHDGEKVNFSMKQTNVFKSCLVRQVNEAVRIEMSTADCVMNSKAEFHQAPLIRVVPVTGLLEEQEAGADPRQPAGRGRGGRGRGGRGERPAGR